MRVIPPRRDHHRQLSTTYNVYCGTIGCDGTPIPSANGLCMRCWAEGRRESNIDKGGTKERNTSHNPLRGKNNLLVAEQNQ